MENIKKFRKAPYSISLIVLSVLLLILTPACSRSASTAPPLIEPADETEGEILPTADLESTLEAMFQERDQTTKAAMPTQTPTSKPTALPSPTPDPVSKFTTIGLDYFAYDSMLRLCDSGYFDCQVDENGLYTNSPNQTLTKCEMFPSSLKFWHQDGNFEPIASSGLALDDPNINETCAANIEELGRQKLLHKHFLRWPSKHLINQPNKVSRAEAALMIEILVHGPLIDYELVLENSYAGMFDDVHKSHPAALAIEGLVFDGIYIIGTGSEDFDPEKLLNLAVLAEWLYRAYQVQVSITSQTSASPSATATPIPSSP